MRPTLSTWLVCVSGQGRAFRLNTAVFPDTHTPPPVTGGSLPPLWLLVKLNPAQDVLFFTWGRPPPPPLHPRLLAHRFGGPLGGPLVPRRLLATPALGGHHLSASARGAGFCLARVHATVLAQGLPAVRELGECGGCWEWGQEDRHGLQLGLVRASWRS